jgi:hypothetical protein
MTDRRGRLHESSFSLSALLKCSVFFPQDIPVNKTVPGHSECSAGNVMLKKQTGARRSGKSS